MYCKIALVTLVLALVGASTAADADTCSGLLTCEQCGGNNGCLWMNCTSSSLSVVHIRSSTTAAQNYLPQCSPTRSNESQATGRDTSTNSSTRTEHARRDGLELMLLTSPTTDHLLDMNKAERSAAAAAA